LGRGSGGSGRRLRLVAYTDTEQLGGADLALSHLVERLDPETEVTVAGITPSIVNRVASQRTSTATAVVAAPRSGHDVRSLAAHVTLLRSLRPDILHVSLASPWSCQYAVAAAAIVRRPRVVAVYQLARPPVNRRQWLLKRLTSHAVTRHVGVGERTSREVEQLVHLHRGSVHTIHNGVPDVALDTPPRPVARPIVGAIGRLEPQKGFDVLLRALLAIPEATGVIVGDGGERHALREIAARGGVADRVVWIDWTADARSYLPLFDVFALPSRFEGFPLALLEALLAERAVVAADVGDVAEAVLHEETGLLVRPDDADALAVAIRRLLSDDALRRRLGKSGRDLVLTRFTASHMTQSFERLYDEILR